MVLGLLDSISVYMEKLLLRTVYEDMLQILLVKMFFTQESEMENLFCGAPYDSEPACSSAIVSLAWD